MRTSKHGLGTLPSNTITNPKEDLKGITTRSGIAYKGPTIPTTCSPSKVVERKTEVTKETVPPTNNRSAKDVQPLVVQVETQILNSETIVAPVVEPVEAHVSAPKPNPKMSIPYPSRLYDQKLRDKANDQKEKFFQIFQDLNFNISFTDALILMPNFGPTIKSLLTNKEKLFELARALLNDHCSTVLLKKLPEKLGDPANFSSRTRRALIDVYKGELTLRVGNKAITFNLDQTSRYSANYDAMSINQIDVIDVAYIFLLEYFLNDDPSSPPLPPQELKVVEPNNEKSSIDEPSVFELKDLPPYLEYAFLEGDDKLPVIIAKDLKDEEETALIKVLKSHKQALTWQLFDIKGINPEFYTHKILMGDDFKPAVQHQRRFNPKIYEVIKKEVLKVLDAELIYPISDSPWVSPVHCVPKKGGFTIVENEENELIPTRLVTGWRVCIDYQKLNDTTHKDHFPLSLMDQMLERLAGNEYYCFLDGF
nr:reverse transcriptase domain-containing protein [Tanacetum cinerariifolium]